MYSFPIWNQSIVPCSVLTVASWPAYKFHPAYPLHIPLLCSSHLVTGQTPDFLDVLYVFVHALRVCVCVCVCMFFFSSFSFTEVCHAKSFQSCPTLCNRMRCNPLGFSVRGILQARILKWVAIPSSRIFLTQGWNLHLLSLLHWQGYWDIIGI